jgi:4-hydroxy-tetrahydrodipicolinate reductase
MEPIYVMVNGLPGNVARVVARHVVKDDRFALVPISLTGPEISDHQTTVEDTAVKLVPPDRRAQTPAEIRAVSAECICVDFTHPSAVNHNARFYCDNNLPFVMGTTGGDRRQLEDTVKNSQTAAVIAPNMAKQIVGFQAMMEYAATRFPGLFEGYALQIKESHQQGKADTSGTAKAMVKYFNALGVPFSEEDIQKERDPQRQTRIWGIPEAYLSGHGWHTYTLTSADGTVTFEFSHKVNGREIYAGGTLDAVRFLKHKLEEGVTGRAFSMIDVLEGDQTG